jgi:alpha-D-xyloside xylohydrolase
MLLEFPQDPTCRTLDRQYLLGDDLLVAPLFHDSRAEYYLPEGQWTHLLTGEVRHGGRWYFDELDFFGVPLWLRENAVIALGADHARVDYDFGRGVRLVCGKLGQMKHELEIFDRDAKLTRGFSIAHEQQTLTVTNRQGLADFEVQLPWATEIVEVDGGERVTETQTSIPVTRGGVTVRATAARVSIVWR